VHSCFLLLLLLNYLPFRFNFSYNLDRYPYEAIRVVTSDGYGLLLERIPRRDARKAVYLQHGVMDSSMG
jgi:hypothetical protein